MLSDIEPEVEVVNLKRQVSMGDKQVDNPPY